MDATIRGEGIPALSSDTLQIDVRAFPLSAKLSQYFSALYRYEFFLPADDSLSETVYPDWAGLHFNASGETSMVAFGEQVSARCAAFAANGPTSKAMHLGVRSSISWSVALNPPGWACYADGPACELANTIVDGSAHPAFARLAPILDIVRANVADPQKTAADIEHFLLGIRPTARKYEAEIEAMHQALRNPDIGDVEDLVACVGISRRTLERLSSHYFGFPPKLLLRRQRFIRSLGKFVIDPRQGWSASLDGQYVDQAHFVRDFRSFMGMTPSEYAQMPHPILEDILSQRLQEQGAQVA